MTSLTTNNNNNNNIVNMKYDKLIIEEECMALQAIFGEEKCKIIKMKSPSNTVDNYMPPRVAVDLYDTINNFNDITYEMIGDYYFKNNNDMVGYNWKEYDLNAGEYTVFSNINYIIQDNNNKYYKLHFIDFYNNLGEKGYPKFEIQEL